MTPYEILGVAPHADDKAIRSAYLELIKTHSPDRAPERFKEIAGAYESVRDEKKRLEYYLFNIDVPINRPFEALSLQTQGAGRRKPPDFDTLKELLRQCMTK